ncbi:hypothetical protein IRT45_27530 [Nocardia sp. BSTN01]|uniref:hypothetical protein n=1 Tax=Nocardia sp. BSTN01 TaxID=2783665 RepID=UPI0018906D07|nr:hypothetical protein [Nocardia sp. BSTN01]MBF5000895.1 hypothetical protein [Nocardia sp. BSTN01]
MRGTQRMIAGILADQGSAEPDTTFLSWGLVGLLPAVAEGRTTARAAYEVVRRISDPTS